MKLMPENQPSVCMAPSQFTSSITVRIVFLQVICAVTFLFLRGVRIGSDVAVEYGKVSSETHPNLRSKGSPDYIRRATFNSFAHAESDHAYDIPSCARDVYVTLHQHQEGQMLADSLEGPATCPGLLIRDDIIITSKECSASNYTFNFASVGTLKAIPHASLNERLSTVLDTEDSHRLGFLLANPPYHYRFINEPVRRTRMFLSHRQGPTLVTNGTQRTEFMRCEGYKPIAHSFPVDGKMVSLRELHRVLPHDILWEEMDINTAPEFKYKDYRWWSRAISRKDEERHIRDLLKQYTGPPGSVSFHSWGHDTVERCALVMEALDPHGHRRDCWRNYYERWYDEIPFSGAHFMDWLDFGGGKFLLEKNKIEKTLSYMHDDEICLKKDFNRETVHYMDDEMRREHEVYITPSEDGTQLIWRYKHNDEFVPESVPLEEGDKEEESHLYMWDLNKTFYVVDDTWDEDEYDKVKHTGIVAGMPGISGGEAYVGKNGVLLGIDFFSGHYRPKIQAAAMMYQWMKNEGYNVTALHWIGVKDEKWGVEKCKKVKWHKIQIPGIEASALNQSCHELTTSPTWILKDEA